MERIRKNERYVLKLSLTNEKPYPLDQVELRLHTVSSQYARYFGKECRLFADPGYAQHSGELVFEFGRIPGGGRSETQVAYIEASDDVDPGGRASALEYEIRAAFNPLPGSATGLRRSVPWQLGHSTAGEEPRTRVSNSLPQPAQVYSKIGMMEFLV